MAGSAAFELSQRSDGNVAAESRANEPPDGVQASRPRPELRRLRPSGAQVGAGSARARPSTVPARSVSEVLRGSGEPLHAPVRQEMGARFGTDFSQVRVHADAAARASAVELDARAYTSGSHIVIGDGGADKRTLAHELSHVIQQRRGPVAGTDHGHGFKLSDPADRDERAAEADAQRVLSGSVPARPPLTPGERTPSGVGTTAGTHVQRYSGKKKQAGGAKPKGAKLGVAKPGVAKRNPKKRKGAKRARGELTPAKLNIRQQDDKITGVSNWPSRPPSNLRSEQGQHRTAYVVFESAVLNRVIGLTVVEAAPALIDLVKEYKTLPRMAQKNTKNVLDGFDRAETILTEAGQNDDAAAVGVAISLILAARNQVPGTAVSGIGGGHAEPKWSGKLDAVESELRKGDKSKLNQGDDAYKELEGNEIREAMWRLLDYNPSSPQGDADKENAITTELKTHYREMRSSWPLTWAWLNKNNYWMVNYLLKNRAKDDGRPLGELSDDEIKAAVAAI